jgi:acetyl esterase/lipase
MSNRFLGCLVVAFVVLAQPVRAQLDQTESWVAFVANEYRVVPNVTYLIANDRENKVDLYLPESSDGPTPVLLYIHGGGWRQGSKESYVLRILPYLEMGWAVVNVQYRLSHVSQAPAAVEDCLCALRWVIRESDDYNFDSSRIVVTGQSAGGHLTLTTGMTPADTGLDRRCPGDEELRVAAMINWYGVTDVADLLDGPNMTTWAVSWFGSRPDRMEAAERVSPLAHVRAGLPPVFTVHGDADRAVPYSHALRLHAALDNAGVPNEFHTVAGGGHGRFNRQEMHEIYTKIHRFLDRHGFSTKGSTSQQQQ